MIFEYAKPSGYRTAFLRFHTVRLNAASNPAITLSAAASATRLSRASIRRCRSDSGMPIFGSAASKVAETSA